MKAPFLVAALAALLAGCAVPHDPPQVRSVGAEVLGSGAGQASIDADWWTAFRDPQLDRLIATALAGNPSLESALARVRVAQQQVASRRGEGGPQVTFDGQSSYQRFPNSYIYPPPYAGRFYPITTAQANFNYTLDLFGRQRALVRGAQANARAAELDAAAARLTIATAIAQTYVSLAGADRLIRVADDFVATRRQALGLAQSRVRNQLASDFDLRQAETLLAEAQQARIRAAGQRDLLIHALAALAGRGADFYPEITAPTLAIDVAPAVPDVLPADLLGRRPDLLAGQARIDAAVANRRVARTDFLPNVSIQALAGVAALGIGNLFDLGSRTYGAGPAVHLPIFDGGRLRAQYRGATAQLDGAVADYDNAVLGAVRDASDALSQVRSADQDLQAQARVVAGLRDTVRLDQVRITSGLGSRLDAIESGFRLLEAEQALVSLQSDALARRIQLVAALGGGFDPRQPLAAAAQPEHRS